MSQAKDALIFTGNELTFICPSSNKITIRENNGEDEGLLSQVRGLDNGNSIDYYLASIITKDHGLGRKPTVEEVQGYKVRDRYYILFKARVHSLGSDFEFKHECPNKKCGLESTYNEDLLDQFDQDLSKPVANTKGSKDDPEKKIRGYREFLVTPYPNGKELVHQWTLTSGREVRMNMMTGLMEQKVLDSTDAVINRNSQLLARDFEVNREGNWESEFTFRSFSSKETGEARAKARQLDEGWEPLTHVECAHCGQDEYLPLLRNGDFFFQDEI